MPPESGGPVAGERLSGKFAVKGGGGPSRSGGVACVVAQIALASGAVAFASNSAFRPATRPAALASAKAMLTSGARSPLPLGAQSKFSLVIKLFNLIFFKIRKKLFLFLTTGYV